MIAHLSRWSDPAVRLVMLLLLAALADTDVVTAQETLTVATWNLEWFYDDHTGDNFQDLARQQSAPSRDDWQWKRDTVAAAIAKMRPDILALQEVENQRVLYYLVQRLRSNHKLNYQIGFVEGHDYYTEQDVAVLYRKGLVEQGRWERTAAEIQDPKLSSVTKHAFAKFQVGGSEHPETLVLVNLHLRAGEQQAERRRRQTRQLKRWLTRLSALERSQLIVLGDFNTQHRYGVDHEPSELDVLRGQRPDAPERLVDLHRFLAAGDRATHLTGAQFDRLLVGPGLIDDAPGRVDLVFDRVTLGKDLVVRGQQDASHWEPSFWKIPADERDVSDHYPVIAAWRFR